MNKQEAIERHSDHAAATASCPVNIVVAGLTRSGLTATCQMLAAGGMRVAGAYPAYEPFHMGCVPWGKINGQVVKLVDSHRHLPPDGTYAVIRLRRNLTQQAKSFCKFVNAMFGVNSGLKDYPTLTASFERDCAVIDEWANQQRQLIVVDFENIIESPKDVAESLQSFLCVPLNIESAKNAIIDRTSDCHSELLECRMV